MINENWCDDLIAPRYFQSSDAIWFVHQGATFILHTENESGLIDGAIYSTKTY